MLQVRPSNLAKPYLTSSLSCRYILENSDHYIVEVKKINKGDLFESFQWVKITKDFLQVNLLNLKAIDSSQEVEERFFDEGYLKFNANTGIFIEKFNSGQHQYLIKGNEMEAMLKPMLQTYFFEDKILMN
jgi:hypothetical protein